MRHLPEMHPIIEERMMRGVMVSTFCNSHYPTGVKVFTVDPEKAEYQGMPLATAWTRRKYENLIKINNPRQRVVVHFT